MKKRIAFIEMETHSALLEQWYLLVREMSSIDFHFFVSAKVYSKLTAIPSECLTVIPSVTQINFSAYDAFVVNTLHRNFEEYKKLFAEKPVLCLVHNLNFSLFFKGINWTNIWQEKERLIYFLKLYLNEKVASKRKLILGAKYFGVISASALETIKKESVFSNKSWLISMNYCQNVIFPSGETIQIVIPGNVSNKRKDIAMVFRMMTHLQPEHPLHFTFLGKPENETILDQLEVLKTSCHPNITVTHYHQFIPWEEYTKVIEQAHLLLCPIKQETSFYWVDEVYGSTKVSGAEADCIFNGKIGIFPSTYPKMDWHNWTYQGESDLTALLQYVSIEMLQMEYEKLQPFTEKYTFVNVKNEMEQQLLKLTESECYKV